MTKTKKRVIAIVASVLGVLALVGGGVAAGWQFGVNGTHKVDREPNVTVTESTAEGFSMAVLFNDNDTDYSLILDQGDKNDNGAGGIKFAKTGEANSANVPLQVVFYSNDNSISLKDTYTFTTKISLKTTLSAYVKMLNSAKLSGVVESSKTLKSGDEGYDADYKTVEYTLVCSNTSTAAGAYYGSTDDWVEIVDKVAPSGQDDTNPAVSVQPGFKYYMIVNFNIECYFAYEDGGVYPEDLASYNQMLGDLYGWKDETNKVPNTSLQEGADSLFKIEISATKNETSEESGS